MADIALSKSIIEKAKNQSKLNKLKKDYYEETKIKKATDIQIKMYQDFEELVFNMSKADGNITTDELLKKSVYDFYSYKRLLLKYIGKKKTNG